MYEVEPDITNSFVFRKVSQEEVMQHYLQIPVSKDLVKSPLRNDNHPTCSFYYNNSNKLIFHDFSGDFHGDCIEVVKRLYDCSYTKALRIIAEDFRLVEKKKRKPTKIINNVSKQSEVRDIKVKIRDWSTYDLDYWNSYKIETDTLSYYDVFPSKYIWLDGKVVYIYNRYNPAYTYYFGNDQFKIYYPKSKKYRFICNTNTLQGYRQLPENHDILIITKSLKDVMVYYQYGIPAIAPQGESQIITEKVFEELSDKFGMIISNYDYDEAGIRSSKKMEEKYGIEPFYIIDDNAKDISDYVKQYGEIKLLNKLSEVGNYSRKLYHSRRAI